ncbi:hypothetical protein [Streptomyces sp. M1013]|uniref:hypothetical protein n=1 Tax=Streptomyces sp. M1013 TaxID=549798 RepID=UPI00117FCF81|nr:hypothetical protein [Streptomyces sp. M1013]
MTRGVLHPYQAASHLTHRASSPPRIVPTAHAAAAALDLARRAHAPRCEQLVQRPPAFCPYAHHHAVGRLLHLAGNASTS